MKQNISLEEAQHLLLERISYPEECCTPLTETLGRVASRDVWAEQNMPSFDRSPFDGYAVRASDTRMATADRPVALWVLEEVPAGHVATVEVAMGTAVKVMTGAPIPVGADTVVKQEEVAVVTEKQIRIFRALRERNNVVHAGENICEGELLVKKGAVLNPASIGLLAEQGIDSVYVHKMVQVAIISTGDELTRLGETLETGRIYDSNSHTLQAKCRELGVCPIMLGSVPDCVEAIVERVQEGLSKADIVITTGGVSVGEYDLVGKAVEALGGEVIFWRVDIKPGSPMLVAAKNGKLIIGLSGNPVAALITFDLLVVPALKKMMGRNRYFYSKLQGSLLNGFNKTSVQRRFLRARLLTGKGMLWIKLMDIQNNSALKALEACNLFVDVPAGSDVLNPGDTVLAHIIGKIDDVTD